MIAKRLGGTVVAFLEIDDARGDCDSIRQVQRGEHLALDDREVEFDLIAPQGDNDLNATHASFTPEQLQIATLFLQGDWLGADVQLIGSADSADASDQAGRCGVAGTALSLMDRPFVADAAGFLAAGPIFAWRGVDLAKVIDTVILVSCFKYGAPVGLPRFDCFVVSMASGQGSELTRPARAYRVLMIAPTSFFADYGCHVRILEEARTLQRMGHQVTIATYHNGNHVPGLDIRRTLPIPWRKDYEVGSSRHKIGLDVFLGAKTLELVIRERFDVIHAHLHEGALIGLILSRLFRLPMVFDFQGSLTGEMLDHHFLRRRGFAYKLFRTLETWIDHHSSAILASTANAERVLIEDFGCRPQQICSLPDCVDTDSFKPAVEYDPAALEDLRHSLGIPPGRKLIVYLGLLVEYQGIGILLQAMQRVVQEHQDAHLLLMGFPSVEFYRTQAYQLGVGDFVTFTGRIPYEQAPGYLALGDVAVAPKLSLTEGSGKLLNYMAVALPTVAFDTPVAREYLGPDGLFAAPGDVESLARRLCDALGLASGTTKPLQSRGQHLRQRAVQHFNWDVAGWQIVNTYRRLLGDADTTTFSQPEWTVTHK